MGVFHALTPFLEIGIIALIFNYLLSFFWNTRSMDMMLGFAAYLVLFALSSVLNLPILRQIMVVIANIGAIAVLIIFQPELRVALSKLSLKGKRYKESSTFDKFLESLTHSVYRLAEKRVGALIVLENEDSLEEYANKAVRLNAEFSSELLESLFTTTTPLHDGAIIVRNQTILAAAAILPLADDGTTVTRSMGTRHRAALGLSQLSDAVCIVISEESGKVSLAREGAIIRGVKVDRFKGVLRSIFTPPPEQGSASRFKLKEWLRQ